MKNCHNREPFSGQSGVGFDALRELRNLLERIGKAACPPGKTTERPGKPGERQRKEKEPRPPRVVSLTTDLLDRGIAYDQLSDEHKEKWDALEWSEAAVARFGQTHRAQERPIAYSDFEDRTGPMSEIEVRGIPDRHGHGGVPP